MRLSYAKNPDTGSVEVLDRNDYYPFGMNMQGVSSSFDTMGSFYNQKYNNKELQETGFYDYGWRQYMPDLGRWFGMDKLSETYSSTSPYVYVLNNPISLFDPDGRVTQDWLMSFYNNSQDGYTTTWTNTGSGFTNNWGGNMDYGANPTNFGSIFTGGISGGAQAYINIPEVILSGRGNTKTWNSVASNYWANVNTLYDGLSAVSNSIFHHFNPFFGQNGPEPGGGGLIMMDSVFDVLGIALANAEPQNRYLAYALGAAAIVATKGKVASRIAASWQGKGAYAGIDAWRDITLAEGKYVVGGLPGQSNFYTTLKGLERSGFSKTAHCIK